MHVDAVARSRLPRRESLRLRASVLRKRTALDAALANGADPHRDPALALRAEQLRSPVVRSAIANTLANVLDAADEPPDAWGRNGPRPPLQRDAIRVVRDDLVMVVARLHEPRGLSAQSVALASVLAWDSASPLYTPLPGATLGGWVHAILATQCPESDSNSRSTA